MRAAPALLLLAACGGDDVAGVIDAGPAADASDPLAGIGAVELIQGGFMFVEGPQWLDGSATLVFSDIPASTIYELTPPSTIATFRMPSDNANGLGVLPDGRLLAAEHGARRVSVSAADGSGRATVVGTFEGSSLNSPNDVIAADDGTIYFTDPPYGIPDADRELDFMGVFRVPAGDDAAVAEWQGPLTARPNGLDLSPDGATLYVSDTATGVVRAWDVGAAGALSGERTLSTDTPGADGLAVDVDGNLFVTTSAGVRVLAPSGETLGTIAVPEQPANCAFGDADGKTLYITARTGLYRVRLVIPGRARSGRARSGRARSGRARS